MSMESTDMTANLPEIYMDTPFLFTRRISEDFWKELQEMNQPTYVFLNMLAHSHRHSWYQRSTQKMRSMRCSMESVVNTRGTKKLSR
ncbi:hypothetical protein F2Q69_00006553 [Brassica cretica]|uniref:Uncharacterized protein n=1 Tax=Brassica cretica TaxID=69181 RepID=A0A8S9PAR4_BRACR|nr:hypothetical protein F2Q69_00006553 [Brassica cretica]